MGLLALAVHFAAFSLAAVMPVATALAAAEAQPFEIVICTVHGPVTMDARDLGLDLSEQTRAPELPRTACDLALKGVTAIAASSQPDAAPIPVSYAEANIERPTVLSLVHALHLNPTAPTRAPPPQS